MRGGVKGHFLFSEIQPDLVCELLTSGAIFSGLPGALGRGQKVKYH